MSVPSKSLFLTLLLACAFGLGEKEVFAAAVSAAPTLIQDASREPAEVPAPVSSDPAQAWADLWARDDRVSFTRRSAHDSRLRLASGAVGATERIEALMAIGCTQPQPVRDRPMLEEWSLIGTDQERGAALLALGEFGPGGEAALLRGLEDRAPLVRGCAMWGLLRSGRRTSRIRVEAVAAADSVDAALATDLLVAMFNPASSTESEVVRFWMDLRWGAARRFGLVDGESWRTRMLEDLLETPEFLDGVILLSAAHSVQLGTRDHLLAHLLEHNQDIDVRAATLGMPEELALLIESGLWVPQTVHTWRVILDQIDQTGSENKALGILFHALNVPEVSIASLRLVVRSGLPEVLMGLEESWPDLTNEEKQLAAQAWAMAGDAIPMAPLLEFRDDPDADVRGQVRVALARRGHAESHLDMRTILEDSGHEEFRATLRACVDQARAPLVQDYLEDLLETLEGDDKIEVATALAINGDSKARIVLGELLRDGFPPGLRGVRCIRAMALRDPAAAVDLLMRAFPVENDIELNIGLAIGIIRAQHNRSFVVLRKALWMGPFDRSVLAGQVIIQVGGLHTLRDELNRAPLDARESDMRRLGFALGEWGGLREVEYLKNNIGLLVGDPVLQGALLGALGRRTH